ncbi:MAG: hypothetical protein JNK05_32240 [Myxococcales bacterium]|nr:hypothetical protein [Myxococcales bacterium]
MRSIGRKAGALLIVCAAAVLGEGCRRPPTGLRVIVTTDFLPSATTPALHTVRLRVTRVSDGRVLHTEPVNVSSASGALPLKFSVFLNGAGGEQVRIEAEAHTIDSQADERNTGLTAARVVTGFVEGEIRVVPMVLYRGCWDMQVRCEPNSTCGPTAMCQSAQVDQRELPTFDRDAGDPDVLAPSMDAGSDGGLDVMDASDVAPADRVIPPDDSPVDVMMPPVDVMPPPADGCAVLPPPAATTVTITGSNAAIGLFDIVSRDNAMMVMPDGGMPMASDPELEVAWAGPRSATSMASVLLSAGLRRSGASYSVVRTPRETLSFGAAPLQALALVRNGGELGALGLEEETIAMMRRLRVIGAPISQSTGVGPFSTFNTSGPFSMPPSGTLAKNAGFAVAATSPMGPSIVACVLPPMGNALVCAFSDPSGMMTQTFTVDFSVAALSPAPRLAGLAIGGPGSGSAQGRLQFVLEWSDGNGYTTCSTMETMPPVTPTAAGVCRSVPATGRIRAGSLSAQWIDGFNCGGPMMMGMLSGWFGALVESGDPNDTLRAGKLDSLVLRTGDLPIRADALANANARTAVSIAPAPCEMLVARTTSTSEVEYRRAYLAGGTIGLPVSLPANTNTELRAVPLAPPSSMPGTDDHIHAFVDGANRVNVVVVPVSSCRM